MIVEVIGQFNSGEHQWSRDFLNELQPVSGATRKREKEHTCIDLQPQR
jgi:hypothetical protein